MVFWFLGLRDFLKSFSPQEVPEWDGYMEFQALGWFLGFFLLYKKDRTFKPWLEFYILFALGLMLDYTEPTVLVELMVFVMVLCGFKIHKNQKEGKQKGS